MPGPPTLTIGSSNPPWQTDDRVATIPVLISTIGDPDGTRTLTSIVALLIAIGLALLLLAVWVFRRTRPDPELLAPLEAMGERGWRRGDPVWQRRRLDELRPHGAKPLAPSVAPPELDMSFDAGPTASGFDDLRADKVQRSGEIPVVESDDDVAAERDGDASDAGVDSAGDTAVAHDAPRDSTPAGVVGPTLDELSDDEFDQDALAAARAELERELAEASDSVAAEQLGLFGRDSTN